MTEMIDRGFTTRSASKLSGYPRSLLYYKRTERNVPLDPDLSSRIEDIILQRPSYGTRRVTAMLRRSGIAVSRKKVKRHMKSLNLLHSHRKKFRKSVPRTIVVSRPNIFWETDFTKVYVKGEGWVYFTAYLDLCSRKIKGYLTSRMSRSDEMIAALDSAVFSVFPDLEIKGLRIISDNGSQLTSRKYENHLMTLKIDHETIHPHTPEEDAFIESYFGHFKDDYIYNREFNSLEEFKDYTDWAARDYNSVRPHSSLNYLTPDEFEERVATDSVFKKKWLEKQVGRYKNVLLLE
jgi:putative transposase